MQVLVIHGTWIDSYLGFLNFQDCLFLDTVPPAGTSTWAAALASRNAKSAFIGSAPTEPRIPSVPKNFLLINLLPALPHGVEDAECVNGRTNVMRPDDVGAVRHGDHRRGHTGRDQLICLFPGQLA